MNTGVTPLTPAQQATAAAQTDQEGYFQRELVDADIFIDETLDGQTGETMSSRMARWAKNEKGVKGFVGRSISKGLDLIQGNHGAQAVAGDAERAKNLLRTEQTSGILPN